MSIWKADKERQIKPHAPVTSDTSEPAADVVDVTALEIAADPADGCDPYNSTGQFLTEELKRYQE
ncbi:MAG: hypothetical protein HKN77_00220 [Woeseiaceae bacterium]|nr:hypothetical protein [Woeseiaceae bacterium]